MEKRRGGRGNGEFDNKITAVLMCSISITQKFADIYLTNKKKKTEKLAFLGRSNSVYLKIKI